jgi:hypothetical protein
VAYSVSPVPGIRPLDAGSLNKTGTRERDQDIPTFLRLRFSKILVMGQIDPVSRFSLMKSDGPYNYGRSCGNAGLGLPTAPSAFFESITVFVSTVISRRRWTTSAEPPSW